MCVCVLTCISQLQWADFIGQIALDRAGDPRGRGGGGAPAQRPLQPPEQCAFCLHRSAPGRSPTHRTKPKTLNLLRLYQTPNVYNLLFKLQFNLILIYSSCSLTGERVGRPFYYSNLIYISALFDMYLIFLLCGAQCYSMVCLIWNKRRIWVSPDRSIT